MDTFKLIVDAVSLVSNSFTSVASAIAIGVFFAKRKELYSAFRLLLNFSFQTTLYELKEKLERLNDFHASEPSNLEEIRNLLHEIAGQMRGNPRLVATNSQLAERISTLADDKKLTEPKKRAMVSEIREVLRNIQINSITSDSRG
mgnify:CR=1 FL=1|jgi:cell division protein FtsB